MDVRRSYKNKNPTRYRDTQKEIINKIREQEECLIGQCREIEQYINRIFSLIQYI